MINKEIKATSKFANDFKDIVIPNITKKKVLTTNAVSMVKTCNPS